MLRPFPPGNEKNVIIDLLSSQFGFAHQPVSALACLFILKSQTGIATSSFYLFSPCYLSFLQREIIPPLRHRFVALVKRLFAPSLFPIIVMHFFSVHLTVSGII
jgi:hypothetical protein